MQMPETLSPHSSLGATARAMLSRDADSMYWMARYIERAEHVARILLINSNLLMDVGDLPPNLQQRQWEGVLSILRLHESDVPEDDMAGLIDHRIRQYMAFDAENPSSLLNCLTRAR